MANESDRLNELCRKLRPIIGTRAEALWQFYISAPTPMARFDAQNMIEAIALSKLGSGLKEKHIQLPPGGFASANGEFELGSSLFNGHTTGVVRISRKDLTRHFAILATTGSGKTNLGFNLCLQFLQKHIAFMVIDWKRSYRALKGAKNSPPLNVFTIGRTVRPFQWNPLRPPPGTDPRTWIVIVSEALEKSHVSGQGVADILIDNYSRADSHSLLHFFERVLATYCTFFGNSQSSG